MQTRVSLVLNTLLLGLSHLSINVIQFTKLLIPAVYLWSRTYLYICTICYTSTILFLSVVYVYTLIQLMIQPLNYLTCAH